MNETIENNLMLRRQKRLVIYTLLGITVSILIYHFIIQNKLIREK